MATRKGNTVYLPEDQGKGIYKENYKNQKNIGIITAIEALMTIRKYSTNELKGIFTPAEWSFLADSLNGTMTTDSFRCNVGALVHHCRDAVGWHGPGGGELILARLLKSKPNRAQVEALYFRVEQFPGKMRRGIWKNLQSIDKPKYDTNERQEEIKNRSMEADGQSAGIAR